MIDDFTFAGAQADMRRGYQCGAPGVLVSGLVWLTAAVVALSGKPQGSVFVLLIGGTFIFPLSVALARLLGHPGSHTPGNPLGHLAMEGTLWLLAGIAVAYATQILRLEWFFPAMLLLIGGRYFTFQTLYGLRAYWICGAVLCGAGLALGLARVPVAVGAMAGAAIELVFAGVLFLRAGSKSAV